MSQAGRKSGARLPPLRAGGSDEWLGSLWFPFARRKLLPATSVSLRQQLNNEECRRRARG